MLFSAAQANRFARLCLEDSLHHTVRRKVFGKPLAKQPVVRYKLATMARAVSATNAMIEALIYRMTKTDGDDVLQKDLGAEASLVKVQATRTFEECAREAAHLHGGKAYVKGNRIESLYRQVLSLAIPGGSEDVLVDTAAKLTIPSRI